MASSKAVVCSKIVLSNCLIQAVRIAIVNFPKARVSYDHNSPSGRVSFYCNVALEGGGVAQYRFRRVKTIKNNTNKYLFKGTVIIVKLK